MALSPQARIRLTLFATIASTAIALLGALAMVDRVRVVDVLALFFGGFGAGAGLVASVVQNRKLVTPPGLGAREIGS